MIFCRVKNSKSRKNKNKNDKKVSEMKEFRALSKEELTDEYNKARGALKEWEAKGLKLDLTRGKPGQAQLDLTVDMLSVISKREDCFSENGLDCRNYGILDGLPETKRLFSELLGIPAQRIMVLGNSSLNAMYDTITRAMLFGVAGGNEPWCRQGRIKFICPSPGYDRHFAICQRIGIEMIPVAMTPEGPDMDAVYDIACSDPSVKGIWCVPKFSNPDGITYSDETVEQFAALRPAANDFRIFWDNAYSVHELTDERVELADIFTAAEKYGTQDNIFYFASTSKITFPGSGVAIMAASEKNIEQIKPFLSTQTIGYDKINQMRHVKYFKNADGIRAHMKRHAAIIKPKFDIVTSAFERELGGLGIAEWNEPKGGYFISLNLEDGLARRVYRLAMKAGVILTPAGATFPYGRDPRDRNLRIAPTCPENDELEAASEILCLCIKRAAAEKFLKEKE